MFNLEKKIIIYDTEYTTWQGAQERDWGNPGEHREIVQIGAILVKTDKNSFPEIDGFDILVKPKINPTLSDYFINLANITQKEVDKEGFDFSEALKKFYQWSKLYPLYLFGGDETVIIENCKLLDIKFPFKISRFFYIRDIFEKFGIPARNYTSGTIVKAFGKEPKRKAHDALNDVRTIIEGLRLL